MKIVVDFTRLKALADNFGKREVSFNLESSQYQYDPIDISLGNEGVSISPHEIEVKGGLLSYQGRQVLLYIKDHSFRNIYDDAIAGGNGGNRFHVANCQTLESMMQRKRYQRYIATTNLSGSFIIGASGRPDAKAKLRVCQNCLTLLNYKQSGSNGRLKQEIVYNFQLTEFFATYSSFFKFMPHYNEMTKIGYTDDWERVSKSVRDKANYICSDCNVNLIENKNLCHTHHINGVKNDNSMANLQVLCADCHRRAHDGALYVKHSDMQLITTLRKNQGIISDIDDWTKVMRFVDPALSGELGVLRRKGKEVPVLGYEINGMQLDAAWPSLRQAISVENISLSGWSINKPGDNL